MPQGLRILIISSGEFSGTKGSLIRSLRDKGCEVLEVRSSLRYLPLRPLYIALVLANALLVYKLGFRHYLNRTYAAYVARSKANDTIVREHNRVDAVILIGANCLNFWKVKKPGMIYTIFTDHTNMLSKKICAEMASKKTPNYDYDMPEARVHSNWNMIEKHILAQQDHIFVMGSHVKDSMVCDLDIDPSKITIVGGGPNLDLDIERDSKFKDYHGKNILFVGLDAKRKGLPVLISAFAKVTAIFPNAKLHIVGVEGDNANGVEYHGRLRGSPLKKLFYETQIFALPAYREPFGIVLLEAMFAKNVCIGTNIEAIPEIIIHGETGYLVEPGNEKILADRIIELFSDVVLLKAMAERAYQIAKRQWTWERAAKRIIDAIVTIKSQQ